MLEVQRIDLQKFGVQDQEVDRLFNQIDLLRRSSNMNISQNGNQARKLLVMKLIDGPIKRDITLDPEQLPIIFGRTPPDNFKTYKRFE